MQVPVETTNKHRATNKSKWKRAKGSSHSGDQTSEQEWALAKPVNQSKKFKVQSLVLSIKEKTSSAKIVIRLIAGIKTGGRKASSTSIAGVGAGHASVRAIDLYASFASNEETILLEARQKHPQNSSLPKAILKPSDASPVEGTTM
jgi:hypothetical protein